MLFIVDPTIACPLAPDVENSVRLNEAFYAHSTVTYKCYEGFWFDDHSLQASITCLVTGQWERNLQPCNGQCDYFYVYITL